MIWIHDGKTSRVGIFSRTGFIRSNTLQHFKKCLLGQVHQVIGFKDQTDKLISDKPHFGQDENWQLCKVVNEDLAKI